jgi:hypothetical protein
VLRRKAESASGNQFSPLWQTRIASTGAVRSDGGAGVRCNYHSWTGGGWSSPPYDLAPSPNG